MGYITGSNDGGGDAERGNFLFNVYLVSIQQRAVR